MKNDTSCTMNECQEPSAPISQVRIKIMRAENATVRDAVDHLRDDGMTAMANAVEEMLSKYETEYVQKILSCAARSAVREVR